MVALLIALALIGPLSGVGEALGDLLADGNLVVERFEVDAAAPVPRALVGDGVAELLAVDSGAAVPAVCAVVGDLAGEEVEHGNFVEWRFILCGEGLVVVPRSAEGEDALPYGVLPFAVAVGEQTLVDGAHRLFDAGGGVGGKGELQVLGEVPSDVELAVPQEVFAHRHGELEHDIVLRAHLLLEVVARHVGEELDAIGKPLDFQIFEEFEVLVLGFEPTQGLETANHGRVGVLERAAVVVGVLVFDAGLLTSLLGE